jgi:ubiquinone/menaquinone biosynthesis C-methylase UbiE
MRQHRIHAAAYDRMTGPLERAVFSERRARLLTAVGGQVLDIGAGTGANIPHFQQASQVIAAEPDPAMRRRLTAKVATARVPVEVTSDTAESLRHADASFDAVVFTLVLCSVNSPDRALAEARRVLRPSGRLIVLEHVRGSGTLSCWQDRLTPIWSYLNAGCHLNRDIATAIQHAGFTIEKAESFDPFPRWAPARPLLEAIAAPRT